MSKGFGLRQNQPQQMGSLGLILCQRKNPETLSGEGSCQHLIYFQAFMQVSILPALPQPPLSAHRLCFGTHGAGGQAVDPD